MSSIVEDPEYEVLITGTLSALDQTVEFESNDKDLQATYISGSWTGTILFEATINGTDWFPVNTLNQSTLAKITSTTANGTFLLITTGFAKSRVRMNPYSSGTANIADTGSDATSAIYAIQAGTWVAPPPTGNIKSAFNYISAIPSSTLTTLITYTVPPSMKAFLVRVAFSGQNVAQYQLFKNASMIDNQWTYFGGELSGVFDFSVDNYGLPLAAGDVITVQVQHVRPFVGDFNGRIFYIETNV